MAQAAFAGLITNCVSRPDQPDGSGGLISGFDCNFYREAAYPFNLTGFVTNGGASLSENALVPGYLVWTTDSTDVTNQTLTDPGAFQDILDFANNILSGTGSSQADLYWSVGQGGSGFPSVATIQAEGYLVLPWNPSGVELYNPGDGNHTFTVDESFPTVPEPSTLVLALTAGLGALIARRRRC